MKVDIYIREKDGKREIRVPILPEEIVVSHGEGTFVTYDIMNKGEVAEPTGVGLTEISWKSEFPGIYRTETSMIHGARQYPQAYIQIIKSWRKNGTPLNLLVTGYPINVDVYVKDYTENISGAFGDVPYEIKFVEKKDLAISKTTVKTQTSSTKRPAAKTTKYTIKKGDTLWGIAKKFLGSGTKWELIYNANKTIIEQTAKKYGKSSSNHGNWIYPGVTLTIPDATSTVKAATPTASNTKKNSTIKVGSYLSKR